MSHLLDNLDIGLTHFVKYSLGGFLLFLFAVWAGLYEPIKGSWPWEVVVIGILLSGVAIYSVHRATVIPLHHGLMCVGWYGLDWLRGIKAQESHSPTRWLGSMPLKRLDRIPAYTAIRRSDFFGERKKDLDLAHAENGLIVMLFSASVTLTGYFVYHQDKLNNWSMRSLLSVNAVLFFLPFFEGAAQHRAECLEMRARRDKVRELLTELGFLQR